MAGRPRHNANPNYNGNPYGHLGQPIQNYDLYALPNSTAADQQTLSPAMSHFRGPNPMMSYFEDAGLGSGGGPSNTTPHPRQPQSYMPSEFGVDTGSYNTGGRRYFTPLPNGPIEAPSYRYNENVSPRVRDDLAGAQDAAGSLRQPVTGPVVSESEKRPKSGAGMEEPIGLESTADR
ncbi:hypothetical protein BDW42DRAFT_197868 [Aspergillus taichungensis]|uniref:Uncharacterized protein n=1 Tax=Aspergillus taichungensis TaxID=482145 RepID=A0A2J5HES9_9EURO|nr:hypothetical protein BDW42DRAFT_197868 [Aspergillus taichungensis]